MPWVVCSGRLLHQLGCGRPGPAGQTILIWTVVTSYFFYAAFPFAILFPAVP